MYLYEICDIEDELFCSCPADAGVRNGFAVDVLVDLLRAVLKVALDHKALNKRVYGFGVLTVMADLLGNSNLCLVVLIGV